MRHAILATVLAIGFLWMCSILASGMPKGDAANHLPSISELEKLSFTAAEDSAASNLPYTEVSAVRGLFLAYNAGSEAVSKYRDPVLTRGASGIAVFKTVSPAVVVVVVGSIKNDKFDPEGLGTGAIIDPRGYVLTNWHVIKDHPDAAIFLKPRAGSDLGSAECLVARVIYQDSAIDLALLRMIEPPSTLHSILVGDISQIQVAEDIHIIGHPHGNLWSYSSGVVSQIRDGYSWTYDDGSKHLAKVLQLQTAISPGNSGGPVVDDKGNILGLVAMSEEGQNLDYAIAADVIKRFLFTGMQMTTRGPVRSESVPKPPQQLFSAKLGDSPLVTKAVYLDVVLYSINGKDQSLIAKFNDGTIVRAWNPDPSGEFRSWSGNLPNGKELAAVASNGTLIRISVRQ
jgi:S1-C subfamily serine protease